MRKPRYDLKLYRGKWAIVWVEDGKTRRHSTGAVDRDEASRILDAFRAEMSRPASRTVADLWTAYMARIEGKPAHKRMTSEWKSLGPVFSQMLPEHISEQACNDYTAARRAKGRKDGTIWTELGDLATVLAWAAGAGHIAKAPRIHRPAKPDPKDRYLTRDEISRLIDAATIPHIRLAIILMLGTAARIGAVLDLTWDRVDFQHGIVKLALGDGERRKGRATVPMNGMVRAALSEAREGALTEHVIEWAERPLTTIRRGFNRAVEDAGLTDVTPHVLRHTAAVHMAASGVPMSKIAQYLGHSDDRITQRVYARFAPDHMADAAEAVNFLKLIKR